MGKLRLRNLPEREERSERRVGKYEASRSGDKAPIVVVVVVDGIGTRRVIVCRSIRVGDEGSEKPRKLGTNLVDCS